jgi:hypothetical protein
MPTFRPILSYPEYNGHRLSRTSCDLRIAPDGGPPLVVSGWKSISHKTELTPGETYGNRAKIQGRTRGKFKPTMDIELYAEDAELVRIALAAAGRLRGLGWMEVSFTAVLTAFEKVLQGAFLFEGIGCRIMSDELSVGDNDDQLARKWSLHLTDMRINGLSAVLENTATGLPV